jgi:hypothetical protein
MMLRIKRYGWIVCWALLANATRAAEQTLFHFREAFDGKTVETRDASVEHGTGVVRVATGHKADWPGITLKPTGGSWDLSAFANVTLDVKNVGSHSVDVHAKLESARGSEKGVSPTSKVTLQPGEQRTLVVRLDRRLPEALRGKLFGMRGYPGGFTERDGLDADSVVRLIVFVAKPARDHAFEIGHVRAGGVRPDGDLTDPAKLFPMLDTYGQYRHRDWLGKVKSADDLTRHRDAEVQDLAAHPGPAD